MKKILTLCMLSSLLLAACGNSETSDDPSTDQVIMYGDDDTDGVGDDDSTEDTDEVPTSVGPSSIPDDLIPSR